MFPIVLNTKGPFSVVQNNGASNSSALPGVRSELINVAPSTPSGWTPADLPDLSLWLPGSSFTFGTTATWADQSGHARDYSATSTARPTAGTGIGGKPTVVFNGGTNRLDFSNTGYVTRTVPYTIAMVFQLTAYVAPSPDYQLILQFWDANGVLAPLNVFLVNPAGGGAAFYSEFNVCFGSGSIASSRGFNPPLAFTTACCVLATYDAVAVNTSSSYKFYFNNAIQTIGVGSGWSTENANAIGAWTGAAGLAFNGPLSEVIVMGSVITAPDQALLANYIFTKYGIVQA